MENTSLKNYKLTQFALTGGCSCKIEPGLLSKILLDNETASGTYNILVGNNSNDDAAVYDLENGEALISTTDFFTPVVDDAYEFGRISAANAISDIYAMGGNPIMAVAILGWPADKLPAYIAQQVIAGGRSICNAAGIALAGGHSIESNEPFFGLAVNGLVKKENIKRNNTANEGDLLFITKPLGTGIICTAAKRGKANEKDLENAIQVMVALNKVGTALGNLTAVTAMTDVTGFGLAGHLLEMIMGRDLSAKIFFNEILLIHNLEFYLDQNIFPDMTTKNFSAYSGNINELTARQLLILCDPQTSGGLLIAVNPFMINEYLQVIASSNSNDIGNKPIGKIISKQNHLLMIGST